MNRKDASATRHYPDISVSKEASATRSLPTLSAAFNLRNFSKNARPMAMDRASHSAPKLLRDSERTRGPLRGSHSTTAVNRGFGEDATCVQAYQAPLETVKERERRKYVAGGMERWRQIEEDERGLQAAAKKAEEKRMENERACKMLIRKAKEDKAVAESNAKYRKMIEELERKTALREREDRLAKEEKERKRVEEEERERQRRMPWQCPTCQGTGKCIICHGAGVWASTFYTSHVHCVNAPLNFGRKAQGCENCGGFSPGILGTSAPGSGLCTNCKGPGLIWPVLESSSPKSRRNASKLKALQEEFKPFGNIPAEESPAQDEAAAAPEEKE